MGAMKRMISTHSLLNQTSQNRPNRLGLIGLCLVAMSISLLVGCGDKISDSDVLTVSLAEVRRLVDSDKVLVLDPRSAEQFAAGHIPRARNIQLSQVSEKSENLDPTIADFGTVIVYGDDPGSGVAKGMTKRLLRAGQTGARFFMGGLSEWRRSGLPVKTSPAVGGAGATVPSSPTPASR